MARLLVAAVLVLVALVPCSASAAPAGFEDPWRLSADRTAQIVAAASPSTMAVAWVGASREIVVARRGAFGAAWGVERIATGARLVRDVQVTTGQETVVAWSETVAGRQRLSVSVAAEGEVFGAPRVVASVGSATSATPRLATLSDLRTVLVWRDKPPRGRGELRVATKQARSAFRTPRSFGRDGVGPAVVATTGGRALFVWATPYRRTRGLVAATLQGGATRPSNLRTVSRSAKRGPLLASGHGARNLVSWQSRRGTMLTRRVGATMGPTRIVAAGPAPGAARIALGPNEQALAAWRATDLRTPSGMREFVARQPANGTWLAHQPLTDPPVAMASAGVPVLTPSGTGLVLWQQARRQLGPAAYDLLVALGEPGAQRFGAPEVLAPGSDLPNDGRGLAVAQAAGTIVAAWPAADGVRVTVRREH